MIPGITASVRIATGATLEFYAPLTSSLTLDTGTATPTFTRATSATVVTSDGLITTVASGEARFQGSTRNAENDWTAHANSDGVLIEEARTNIAQSSEDFGTWWGLSNLTVGTGSASAPDGNTTANLLTAVSAGNAQFNWNGLSITGTEVTLSIFLKKGVTDWAVLRIGGLDTIQSMSFDLTNGVVGNAYLTDADPTAYDIEDFGDGWYRCWIHCTTVTAKAARPYVWLAEADGDIGVAAGDTIYAWGAQFEEGAFPTSYIPTTTATVTRNADILRYDYQPPALSGSMLAIYTPLSASFLNNLYGINSGNLCRYMQTSGGNSTVSARDGATNLTYGVASASVAMSLGLTWEDGASPEQATYLDGSQSNTAALDTDGYVSGANIGIGVRADGNELWLSGAYKEIKFYDTARTQAEMEADTT